jgi:hypothetical protein
MKNWKQILAPLLVFVLGALCGVGGTALFALRQLREVVQADVTHQRQLTGEFLARRLRLDDEQRAQAQPIFDELSRDLLAVRREVQPRVRAVVGDAAERLRPMLRPRQERQLDELLARARLRWERIERRTEPE